VNTLTSLAADLTRENTKQHHSRKEAAVTRSREVLEVAGTERKKEVGC
jgi:hypothetical protein